MRFLSLTLFILITLGAWFLFGCGVPGEWRDTVSEAHHDHGGGEGGMH